MVGLKTFWITICALFLLAACVPQTKQTECKANEAFNASLRTCVPVVGGPSSFLTIDTYSPSFTQTRTKGDTTFLSFNVSVANPYNQSYSIAWERVFNAAPESICSNSHTCTLIASLYEVGSHVITAKVVAANGAVVDTHSFELKITNLPKPAVNTASLTPATYAFDKLPTDPRVQFSFTVRNPTDSLFSMNAADNYRTTWSVIKNGSTIYTETDTFTNFTNGGTNTAFLGTPPTPYFNPATIGVGSYLVRAAVQNDNPGEVVAEYQWNVTVRQPDLANVSSIGFPAPGVTVTAHNGVGYNDFPTYSWVYGSGSPPSRPNFCVTVDDADGTYAGDGKTIQVRWYLNSTGAEICTKKTTDALGNGATQQVCLVDALTNCENTSAPFDTNILELANAAPTVTQNQKVTARLFDEATSYEFERGDVIPGNGSYPVEWLVTVKPVNVAPTVTFGTSNPSGCTTTSAYSRTGCQVDQGTAFTLSFTVTDDFYSASAAEEEFEWDLRLRHNGTDIATNQVGATTSCTKALGATTPAYTTQWTCSLMFPHHIPTGPLNPTAGTYQAVLTLSDSGSEVGGTTATSPNLTWSFVVREQNPSGIVLTPQSILAAQSNIQSIQSGLTVTLNPADSTSFARELDSILFNMHVTDAEVDHLQYQVSLCTDNALACTASVPISSNGSTSSPSSWVPVTRTADTNPLQVTGTLYQLPEDLLIRRHASPIDVDRDTSRAVYFKVDVKDVMSTTTGSTIPSTVTDSEVYMVYVRNFNPPPVFNTAAAVPAIGSTTVVYSGYQFSIDPGSVTDPSGPAAERDLKYQWYARFPAGIWTAVTGATDRLLRYTPGNVTGTIELQLCVGDNTAANPVAGPGTGTCAGTWYVTPKPYLYNQPATGSGNLGNELAVWHDDTNTVPNTAVIYSAYVDQNFDVFVEKTVRDTSGNIVLTTQTIQFEALESATPNTVSNLSIAGSADSVYVAYIASTSSAPNTLIPRIRRIDKSFDVAGRRKIGMPHPAPFGFNYAPYGISCSVGASCDIVQVDGDGSVATIELNNTLTPGETVTINGHVFTASGTPAAGPDLICSDSACASMNSTASNLADKINASTAAALHGITAVASNATVELYSQYDEDFIDFDGTLMTAINAPGLVVASGGLGRIFVSAGRWHLPMINSSLGGTEQNNVTVVSGAADVHLRSGILAISANDTLAEMGRTAAFDAKLNLAGQLVVARISGELNNAGALAIYRYTLSGMDWMLFDTTGGSATDRASQDIQSGFAFQSVRLAANAVGNPYYYVLAQEQTSTGGEYRIGRYNPDLDTAASFTENTLSAKVSGTTSSGVITDTRMLAPDLVSIPGLAEARIFFNSVGTGTVSYPRLARWRSDDSVTCGACVSLIDSIEHRSTARIGLSQVVSDLTLGAVGASASENVNDAVFALFSSDLTATDTFKPQIGVINLEAEAIHSSAVDGTGLFRPPFVLDQ
jgi:hypothetical protein